MGDDGPVPAGMPWWCRLLVVVPLVAAAVALWGNGGQDLFEVTLGAAVAYWVTGSVARWLLVRQGRPEEVARRWVDEGLGQRWMIWPVLAFTVWATADAVRAAQSPVGSWWDWGFVVFWGVFWLFVVALAAGALRDWWRRRAS
ncbi:hypothetical protein [Pseudokineococcus lusitanus]|uniref:Uncharacterized protein n=1 Tax=Pseudokineococcus lusitanus TaxID=763993 RepID=A0A3N1HQA4_9ACTN|nr:hypothetical protein [Pseudokineococcus lusitanus]ROP44671.1 hypothetical protein EDC03_0797 [Pseudokineococcus lusitanus]